MDAILKIFQASKKKYCPNLMLSAFKETVYLIQTLDLKGIYGC